MGHGLPRATFRSPMPRPILAAAFMAGLWGAGCGGDGTTEPAPPPNRSPVVSGSIPAQTVAVGETATVNVAGYFTDPDGNALSFTATSSNAAVASVSVAGSVVTLTGVAAGSATVTVTATDSGGLSVQQQLCGRCAQPGARCGRNSRGADDFGRRECHNRRRAALRGSRRGLPGLRCREQRRGGCLRRHGGERADRDRSGQGDRWHHRGGHRSRRSVGRAAST